MLATKHTQHAPSMKTDCDYFYGWIKKTNGHMRKNLTQNWWAPEIEIKLEKEEEEDRRFW